VLRPKPWLVATVVTAAVLSLIGAVFLYRRAGWGFASVGLALMSVLGVAAIVELATSRIVLADSSLESGPLWSRRRYAAADVASVTWARGVGVSLKLTNGGWAKLPDMGYDAQGLTNTLRAWLKHSRPDSE